MDAKIPSQEVSNGPDYAKIFRDMAAKRNIDTTAALPQKKSYSSIDVININEKLFAKQTKESFAFNQKHRAYDKKTIELLLTYQHRHELSNSEMARLFKLSRNTLSRWKAKYQHF